MSCSPSDHENTPLSRQERKDQTRKTLVQAALRLMDEGRSFTSLGIREIAREAGMVPNGFYRHFRNTDELGLSLVDEVALTLCQLLRQARQPDSADTSVVRKSVRVYHQYVCDNRLLFRFISSERAGGSRILRMAIRQAVSHYVEDMASDMQAMPAYQAMALPTLQRVCSLIANTMLAAAPEILDLPVDQPALAQSMEDNFVEQLQLILLGASVWRSA
ncbi:MAG: HTH-type transcriptional repressor FabR [Betaproteobacteria bacterium]|nr:HTH-type transcriptional repressor FabR [Betaproteobacteria bacterium]